MSYFGNSNYNVPYKHDYGFGGATAALGAEPLAQVGGITGYARPSAPRGRYPWQDSSYNYLAGYNGNPNTAVDLPYNGGFSGYSGYPTRVHQGALGYGLGHSGFENQYGGLGSNLYSPKGSYYGGERGVYPGIDAYNTRRGRLGSEVVNSQRQFNLRDSLYRLRTDNQVDWILNRY